MRTVWKYTLGIADAQTLSMPYAAKVLCVAVQGGSLCLWAEVNATAQRRQARNFYIVGTGNPLPSGVSLRHVGSVVMPPFVWHVYEEESTR